MFKIQIILLLVSILYISSIYSANEYASALLVGKDFTGSAKFAYGTGETPPLVVQVNTGLAGDSYSYIVLNHGDLSKAPAMTDIYNPDNQANDCSKVGFIGQGGQNFNGNTQNTVAITGDRSIVGLMFVVFKGQVPCNAPALRELKSVEAITDAVAWGIIGIGNINISTVPTVVPFTSLVAANPNNAFNPITGTDKYTLTCNLAATAKASGPISGTVYFATNNDDTEITITAKINGITKVRGIHIHTYGDISINDGSSVGGHWKNATQVHNLPNNDNREYGDLGNICSYNENIAYYKYTTNYFPLTGNNNLIGRAIAVHANRDDGTPTSFGDRVAWCVIGVRPSSEAAPFTVPSSLAIASPPVCATQTTTGSATTTGTTTGSGSMVKSSILFVISALLLILW